MFTFAAALAARVPAVAVLANGGMISKKEVLAAVRMRMPTVVIEGSGRLADQIARAVHRRDEDGAGWDPVAAIPDADLREVVLSGCVTLFSVTGHGEALRELLVGILAAQWDRMAAQAAAATATAAAAGSGGASSAGPAAATGGRAAAVRKPSLVGSPMVASPMSPMPASGATGVS